LNTRGEVEVAHEDRELQQDLQAVDRDGRGHRGQYRERRELHHVACDLQHRVRELVDRGDQRLRLLAERGQRDAEEHREHDDLQDLVVRHRLGERLRHQVADEILQREFRGREVRRRTDVRQRQPQVLARLEQVGHDQAEDQRDQRRGDEPAERLAEHAPDRLRIAHVRDADDQRREHQRADQHLDQAQEHVGHDRHVTGDLRRGLLVRKAGEDHVAEEDADHHRDQDPGRGRQALFHGEISS
jgi:hypothetical protein